METIVKIGRLMFGNKLYRTGDMLDISEDEIARLGSSVERDVPTVEKLDERDTQIDTLKAKVEELEIALAVASTPVGSPTVTEPGGGELPTSAWTASEIKQYLDGMEIEYGVRMSKIELLELVNQKR